MDIEREACPQCGEATPVAARICAYCQSSLLVNLRVERVPDTRVAYHAARGLAALGPPAPSFLTAKKRLDATPSVVLTGATREFANLAIDELARHQIEATITSSLSAGAGDEAGAGAGAVISSVLGRWRVAPVTALAIAVFAVLAGLLIWAQLKPAEQASEVVASTARPVLSTTELAAIGTRSSVKLKCGQSQGAGFFVEPELVVTNHHVCEGKKAVTAVFADGHELNGRLVRSDPWFDMALVRVPGAAAQPLEIGDATKLSQGDRVMTIGTPEGLEFTVAEGILSHINRTVMGVSYLQIDASVHHGNSGGPVLDQTGKIVGMVTLMLADSSSLGLALPSNYLFADPAPLLLTALPDHDQVAWSQWLKQAAEAEKEELAELKESLDKPGLIAACVVESGEMLAIVFKFATRKPRSKSFTFAVSARNRELCEPWGNVESWATPKGGAKKLFTDSRFVNWLSRNKQLPKVWVGMARLGTGVCPSPQRMLGAMLTLPDGDPRANQAQIAPMAERDFDRQLRSLHFLPVS